MRRVAIACVLLAGACAKAEPTVIDGSSAERFEESTRQARRDLPDADRLLFDRALRTIGGRRHSANPDTLARVTFNGMTAAQVVADQRGRE